MGSVGSGGNHLEGIGLGLVIAGGKEGGEDSVLLEGDGGPGFSGSANRPASPDPALAAAHAAPTAPSGDQVGGRHGPLRAVMFRIHQEALDLLLVVCFDRPTVAGILVCVEGLCSTVMESMDRFALALPEVNNALGGSEQLEGRVEPDVRVRDRGKNRIA